MLNKFSFLATLFLLVGMALGCDGGGGGDTQYQFGSSDAPIFITDPAPDGGPVAGAGGGGAGGGGAGGGGGGVVATLTFAPTSPLSVTVGGTDVTITATGTPAGGTISLSNIVTGGTGGTFTGPTGLTFDFTTSSTTLGGTATVDVTYTPLPPDLPVTVTYTVNVVTATTLSYLAVLSPPLAIPDFVSPNPGFVTSMIDTNAGGSVTTSSITDVRVAVDVTHTWRGDLRFSLTSPSITTVVLVPSSVGTSIDDFRVIFDDGASSPIASYGTMTPALPSDPISSFPSFFPSSLLSGFGSEDANGVWTLTVADYAGGDIGTLNQWALAFDGDTSIF